MLEQRIAYLCQARCFCNFLYTLLVLIAAYSCTPRWVRTSSTEKMSVVYFLFLFFGYCLVQLTSRTLFGSSTFFLHLPSRQHMHMNESIHCNFIIFCLADVPIEFTHISSAQIAFVTTEICTKRSQKQFVDILTEINRFPTTRQTCERITHSVVWTTALWYHTIGYTLWQFRNAVNFRIYRSSPPCTGYYHCTRIMQQSANLAWAHSSEC